MTNKIEINIQMQFRSSLKQFPLNQFQCAAIFYKVIKIKSIVTLFRFDRTFNVKLLSILKSGAIAVFVYFTLFYCLELYRNDYQVVQPKLSL